MEMPATVFQTPVVGTRNHPTVNGNYYGRYHPSADHSLENYNTMVSIKRQRTDEIASTSQTHPSSNEYQRMTENPVGYVSSEFYFPLLLYNYLVGKHLSKVNTKGHQNNFCISLL